MIPRRKLKMGPLLIAAVLPAFVFPCAVVHAQTAYQGYTLYSPTNSKYTYLIDMNGTRVHTWQHKTTGGYSAYLLPNGHLLRAGNAPGSHLTGAASHGLIEEVDWNGNVVWQYTCAGSTYVAHHDLEPMPNGNVLLIVWEVKTAAQAAAAGRTPGVSMWPDYILEIQPTGNTATPVWEWHAWDHLIQDKDPSKPNYGVVASHPELININTGSVGMGGDWMHLNGISYNPELDQIVVSSHLLNEIYVIDHSTTTAQAAGHTGGRYGRGGDILYRWGKPSNYGAPGSAYFNVVHCAWWVPKGMPGEGNILAFNNRQGTGSSIVVELVPPHDTNGGYTWTPGTAYGPSAPTWTYSNGTNFYSQHLGGNQRLPNGNTLITESTRNRIIEVSPGGSIVWQFNTGVEVARSLRYATDYPGLAALGGTAKIAGPASVSFDTVAVKTSAERDIVLKNTGTAQLAITATVAAPTVFSIVSGGGSRTIDAGDSATVRVKFSPLTAGSVSGTLTVSSNASNAATFVVSLSGVAVDAPILTPNTSNLDFGSVFIGSTSTRTLQITNTGTGTLTITGASIVGTHAADFTTLSPSVLSITAGKKDSIILSFAPSESGNREAELRIQSNDRANPVITVRMTGFGERPLPVMVLSPDVLAFDTLSVGEERLRDVTIRNTGNGSLTVTGTSITGPDAACFTVARHCAGTIEPQKTDSLTIRFSPATPGDKEAIFSVSGNDPLHPSRVVALRGTALPRLPLLAFEPQELTFDTVEVGSNTTGRILLSNLGNGTLNIRNPSIGGVDASSFTIVHGGPSALFPGARDSMTIRFTPSSTGWKSATLSFTTDDPQRTFVSIPLGGTGVSHLPAIRLSAASLDFGARELGSPCKRKVIVSNIGTADLHLHSQVIAGADTGDFSINRPAQNVLAPGGADSIILGFAPTAVGSRTAILRIDSNDPVMRSVEIALSGAGINRPTPRIVVSPQAMDFGVVPPGNETTRFIEITNSGTADLTITVQGVGGKDSAVFSISRACSPILAPSETDSIGIRFRPDRLGACGAVLSVGSSDSSSPVVHVSLTGVCAESAAPRIAVSRHAIDFGDVNVGLVKDEDVTIFNTGAADLLIQRMDFLGIDTADFSIVLPPSSIVPLGDSSLLRLRLTASSGGPRSALLRLQTNDPISVYTDIVLSGTVVGAPTVPLSSAFTIFPPYPNPFSSRTNVVVETPTRHAFTLHVLDALGRRIRVLHDGTLEPGRLVFAWDGTDAGGKRVAPGVYRVVADAGGKRLSTTVVLLPIR